jgi:hypothetical protein
MTCSECRTQLRKLIDEHWVPEGQPIELPEEIRSHAAECASCAPQVEAVRRMLSGAELQVRAPEGLADHIADAVLESDAETGVPDGTARRPEARESRRTRRPRRAERMAAGPARVPQWAQLAAAAVVLVVAAVVVTSAVIGSGAQSDSVVVHLSLEAPEAEAVSVVGDWNDWDPKAHVMKDENGDGVWEVRIEVSKDREYEYQFLLNGDKWIPDPNAPLHVSDGFGGKNSVLNI